MRHIFLVFSACILIVNFIFSQEASSLPRADFFERASSNKTESNNQKTVFFTLLNSSGIENEITKILSKDEKIYKFVIKEKGCSYAVLEASVNPEYILNLISPLGVVFDITTIKVLDRCFIDCNLPDDFPVYRNNGNPKIDKNAYIQSLDSWRKLNPGLYEKYIGL